MTNESVRSLDERRRDLTLLPCYIDTNIIINATLESDDDWKNNNQTEYLRKQDEIESANKLFHTWNPYKLSTSRYAIAEFFVRGQRGTFNKSFEELNEILENEILINCSLLPAKFTSTDYPKGIGFDDDFKALEIFWKFDRFWQNLVVSKDGTSAKGRSGGVKNPSDDLFTYDATNLEYIRYEFPFVEYLLFNEICKLTVSRNIGLKDLLHVIYIKGNEIIFFITHDSNLRTVIAELKSDGYFNVTGLTAKEFIDRFG